MEVEGGRGEQIYTFWTHLGAYGSACLHLEASGYIWKHLGASGGIWKHLGASTSLGASRTIWKHLGWLKWVSHPRHQKCFKRAHTEYTSMEFWVPVKFEFGQLVGTHF